MSLIIFLCDNITAFGRLSLHEVNSITASSSYFIFGIQKKKLENRACIFFINGISFKRSSKNIYDSFHFSVQGFLILS
jgi:hypothetical protein